MAKKPTKHSLPKSGSFTPFTPGKKNYRKERYIPYIMRAEIGIHEAAAMESNLTDVHAQAAVKRVIARLQRGEALSVEPSSHAKDMVALVEWRILDNLQIAFEKHGPLSNQDLIGCLRTILDSIETWSGRPLGGRGYLGYLAGFMKQLGVDVRLLSQKEVEEMGIAEPTPQPPGYDPDRMDLLQLGRYWLKYNADYPHLIDDFADRAQYVNDTGQAAEVLEVCRQLVAETDDPLALAELYYHQGVALRFLGQLDAAIEALQIALEHDEEFIVALDELGTIFFEQGDYQSAVATWRHSLKLAPENVETWWLVARAERALGRVQQEERALRHLIESQPAAIRGLVQLADCLMRQGNDREANLILRRVVATGPAADAWFEDWAHWLWAKERIPGYEPKPLAALEREEKQKPNAGWPNLLKAVVYDRARQTEAAQRELALARQRIPIERFRREYLPLIEELFPECAGLLEEA